MKLNAALQECADALSFFDRVKTASLDEKIAVGHDHWDRLETALRKVVAANQTSEEMKTKAANTSDKLSEFLTLPELVDSIVLRTAMLDAVNLLDKISGV